MACEVFLIRHGETTWNAEGRFQGALDSQLTTKGRAQADHIGRALAEILQETEGPHLHVSSLGRARETAALITPHLRGAIDTRIEHRLREVSIGSWDGLTPIDIDAGWPGLLDGSSPFDWFFRSLDGETYDAAVERVQDWLAGLNGTVIAVSHGLLGRIIRGTYLGVRKEQALQLPVPPDVIWHLHSGKIDALPTG
ncbi:putative phosphoglycerate mutase [Novosphingobium sp. Rr 2-17]|uniref:histidine phosphatase family protein n=1 Tax=Novosphingobium sp. Rr 2-17 TaxID=555793 RepID=UPI000269A853|nr:histidine phosphatase family protein [Novosphingobium sp. Rr 2-17]EIZ78431.1 putative phosphoglycerate mutase [Novosphingobium sp. Rr 2-17]